MIKRTQPTVVFILSVVRSGSTWLNLVLGSHSWASDLGEYNRPFLHIPYNSDSTIKCPSCTADGLPDCVIYPNIINVPEKDAYHFAFSKSGKPVLIDASKDIDWCARFVIRNDVDPCIIHLIRHPCGFVKSQMRRSETSADQLLTDWEITNRSIKSFVASAGVRNITAFYDDLADNPQSYFPIICEMIGYQWEKESLRYWEHEHHGFCANGPTLLYLRDRSNFSKVGVITGDDPFYQTLLNRPINADRRWRERLPSDFCQRAIETPYSLALREKHGQERWQL